MTHTPQRGFPEAVSHGLAQKNLGPNVADADLADVACSTDLRLYSEMTSTQDILAIALAQFPLPSEVFAPGGTFWLTLYLVGDPARYVMARPALEANGWKNLCNHDDFAGFSYPKRKVRNDVGEVRDMLQSVIATCHDMGMGISLIDADIAFDPKRSAFRTLYKAA
ncbi:hypothetical protein H9N28_16470 [Rhodobacter capsulatus]|uniref:hypothetical protein n=1 Tax=Rhodobacter capsulatus TaxID=1061 RepID=UPI0011BCFE75|nr:hypothetical protein [Rhodobacter capsulatus]QNR63112.1 hypothetical protein H9N28_16470 [Rhodobacter capsulatus]